MKFALVGPTHPFRGGIAHYTTLLCRALERRHEVRFFSLSRQYPELLFPGKTQKDSSAAPFEVANEPTLDSMNPWTWFGTARRIAAFAPDLAIFSWWHPFFGPSFGTVARRARRRGVPSCFLCHNVIPHETSRVDRTLSRYAFGGAAGFITHSDEDAANLKRLLPQARVRKNPHPTYDAFAEGDVQDAEDAKAALGLDGKRVLLFFGYIRPYKGLAHLLDAVLALGTDDGYHLLVVGESYEPREKYARQLDALVARDQLTLVDRYVPNEEVPRFYAAADLVMVPYLSATQSGIVQMAYGFDRPVVATTVGGLPEVVEDGATGYLVPPADAAALADAVRRYFAADPAHFRRAIDAERDKYSWERMVDTLEAVADDVRTPHPG